MKYLKVFATLLGMAAGLATLTLLLTDFLTATPVPQAESALVLRLLGMACTALLVMALVNLTSITVFVLLLRGRFAVGWVLPKAVKNLSTWAVSEWRFVGNNGPQEGIRILGLELAFQGTLA